MPKYLLSSSLWSVGNTQEENKYDFSESQSQPKN